MSLFQSINDKWVLWIISSSLLTGNSKLFTKLSAIVISRFIENLTWSKKIAMTRHYHIPLFCTPYYIPYSLISFIYIVHVSCYICHTSYYLNSCKSLTISKGREVKWNLFELYRSAISGKSQVFSRHPSYINSTRSQKADWTT